MATDPREIPPEEALSIARACHTRARALREESQRLNERRNVAVMVAVELARSSQVEVADALGVTATMVRHILAGRRGGKHLISAEVYGVEPDLDLSEWLR